MHLSKFKSTYLFTLILLVIAFFSFYRLGNDVFTADSHFWYQRTLGFTDALLDGDFSETYQNPKPGVTVYWLSGIGLESFFFLYETIFKFKPDTYTYDTFQYVDISARAPLIIIFLLLLVYLYKFAKDIFGESKALLFIVLLALQPYLVGVVKLFHGDGTMFSFMIASSFMLIYALTVKNSKLLIIFSGVFGGLAFLAKIQAIFLAPYLFLIVFLDFILGDKNKSNFKSSIITILLWVLSFVLSIFIFFPALWVSPQDTLTSIYNEAVIVKDSGRNGSELSSIYFSGIFKILSPLNIVMFGLGLIFYFYNLKKLEIRDFKLITYSFLFIIFYFLQMQIVYQKSLRYLIPIFPFVSLIALYGFKLVSDRFNKYVTSLIFISGVLWLGYLMPHYIAPYENAPWGSMAVEAANYLNAKPESSELKVVVNPKEHTFRPFFAGKTFNPKETLPNQWEANYLVLGRAYDLPEKYSYCVFEKAIDFRGRNYWNIYSCEL